MDFEQDVFVEYICIYIYIFIYMFKKYIYTLRYLQGMLICRVYQNIGWSNIEVKSNKTKQSY